MTEPQGTPLTDARAVQTSLGVVFRDEQNRRCTAFEVVDATFARDLERTVAGLREELGQAQSDRQREHDAAVKLRGELEDMCENANVRWLSTLKKLTLIETRKRSNPPPLSPNDAEFGMSDHTSYNELAEQLRQEMSMHSDAREQLKEVEGLHASLVDLHAEQLRINQLAGDENVALREQLAERDKQIRVLAERAATAIDKAKETK